MAKEQPQFAQHLPKRPFKYMTTAKPGKHEGSGFVYILDADGNRVASVWGTPNQKLALAELFIDVSDTHA